MKIQYVALEWVNYTWDKVERFLADALAHSNGDYTVEQVKVFVTQGRWVLIVAVDDSGDIHGAATVEFFNRPDDRVAFITAIGGKLVSSADTFEQLRTYAKSMGATAIEGAARESIARLWRRYGFEEKYRIVGVKL
jgi:hypothetical protein